MIDGNKYIEVVKIYFHFLITEFGFKVSEEINNGNFFYRLRYINKIKAVTVSYENIENYLSIFISILQNGELPDYDDKTKTLHLNKLNIQILSSIDKSEVQLNNDCFAKFNPKNELERKLLKSAKELRLCLKHFDEYII
ncbi:hypothetical protein [Arachidicoccus sp.]|jgi:hypothetical protein|uniref:hypothetical protein n=1 Tax=Arachidicoccus sp. TaxID=1872624 RepID=UPI003D1D0C39